MIEIDPDILNSFIGALTLLILAIIAWYNRQRTVSAATTAAATTQTALTNQAMAAAPAAAMAVSPAATTLAGGFVLPRDGNTVLPGLDGWYARINPSPQAATLPDDKCWQAVSAKGTFYSGDKETVIYLITHPDAAGWRTRNA